MPYVTDTHALVWHLTVDKRLGADARLVFERAEAAEVVVIVPTVVLAEVLHIARNKRITITFQETLARIEKSSNYEVALLDLPTLKAADTITADLELHDRLIVATAQLANAPLLTKYTVIQAADLVSVI
jgi:predicted nucleic acid-binding protein